MQKICEETEAAAGLGVPSEHKEKLGPTSDKKEVRKRLDCSGDKITNYYGKYIILFSLVSYL